MNRNPEQPGPEASSKAHPAAQSSREPREGLLKRAFLNLLRRRPDNKQKEPVLPEPTLVALRGKRLGHEINKHGEEFPLKSIYGETSMHMGGGAFVEVYFRTKSGNIYRLDREGVLISALDSKSAGTTHSTRLPTEYLEKELLTVGQPFRFGRGDQWWTTSEITEIVPADARQHSEETLKGLEKNNIIDEFSQVLPPTRA